MRVLGLPEFLTIVVVSMLPGRTRIFVRVGEGDTTISDRAVGTFDGHVRRAAGPLLLARHRDVDKPDDPFVEPKNLRCLRVGPYAAARAPGKVDADTLLFPLDLRFLRLDRSIVDHHRIPRADATQTGGLKNELLATLRK